jgi:hypothetical protein
MSHKIRRALRELSDSIDRNLPQVEAKLRQAGVTPDPALVYTAAKYFQALNKLAAG